MVLYMNFQIQILTISTHNAHTRNILHHSILFGSIVKISVCKFICEKRPNLLHNEFNSPQVMQLMFPILSLM